MNKTLSEIIPFRLPQMHRFEIKRSKENLFIINQPLNQVSEAQAFEIKFMDIIGKTHELNIEVYKKISDYEQKLTFEEKQGQLLKSSLQLEQKKCREFEMKSEELTEKIKTLTKLNESLAKENSEIKNEVEQCQGKVKGLLDDLNLKDIRLNDLDKKYQKLLKEKASFNKNLSDRLTAFVNGLSFSESDDFDITSVTENPENIEESAQNDNKRSCESPHHGDIQATKRQKTNDPLENSPDDVSTDNQNYEEKYETVQDNETSLDVLTTQMIDDILDTGN